MTFNRAGVIEGDSLDITVKAWNEGNYASDVLVVFYAMDSTGDAYSTPEGVKRMKRVASTTVPLMAPKPVLENDEFSKLGICNCNMGRDIYSELQSRILKL